MDCLDHRKRFAKEKHCKDRERTVCSTCSRRQSQRIVISWLKFESLLYLITRQRGYKQDLRNISHLTIDLPLIMKQCTTTCQTSSHNSGINAQVMTQWICSGPCSEFHLGLIATNKYHRQKVDCKDATVITHLRPRSNLATPLTLLRLGHRTATADTQLHLESQTCV